MRRAFLLMMAGLLFAPVTPAQAQEASSTPGSMLIILDASGSMNRVDEDGVPFIDKAKNAVLELIDALPDDINVGLRVYGHREPNTDKTRGCQDTELVAPVVPLDREAIRTALEVINASGFTPIGLSLQEAASDLPDTGPRTVVLISDGEDTCAPPDPCDVAEELFGAAIDVRIESIGFLVDSGSAAEQQLRCIAEVSGGEYQTVDQADALVAKLGQVADEFLDWRPPPTINGALERAQAPAVPFIPVADWLAEEPPTFARAQYASVIMPGETRWFRIDTWEGEWFWAFADLDVPQGMEAPGEFEGIIIDPSGDRVEMPAHEGMVTRAALPGTSPMVGVKPQQFNGPYPYGTYYLGFHWDAPARVMLGSLLVNVDILGDNREAQRTRIEGSLDPEMAPVLDLRDQGFIGPLAAGETRWYRVDTDTGTNVDVSAVFPAYRVAGTNLGGEFSIEMRNLDGTQSGGGSQSTWTLGAGTPQAVLEGNAATSSQTGTILVGFRWEGGEGASEVRFGVGIGGGGNPGAVQPGAEDTTATPTTTAGVTTSAAQPPAGDQPTESSPFIPLLVFGIVALIVVAVASFRRGKRSG